MAFPIPVSLLSCIVDGCDWTYQEPSMRLLAGRHTDEALAESLAAHNAFTAETAVTKHLDGHTALEWARTVQRLRETVQRAVEIAQPAATGGTSDEAVRRNVMWVLYGGERPVTARD